MRQPALGGIAATLTANVAEWAELPELHRPGMRNHYTLPLTGYAESFQADTQRFADRLANKDTGEIYHDQVTARTTNRRRRRAARPRAVETRLYHVRPCGAALVLQNVPIETLRTLRDLVVPIERAVLIRGFYLARHGDEPNSQVAGILETLR